MENVIIGIRTFNSEQFLDGSLNSVINQNYPNMKVVVFDDKSTDKTMKKLRLWQTAFIQKGIQFEIHSNNENGGCGQSFERLGRIVADKIGDDDIFVMLDSDDKFTSTTAISDCVSQMKKNGANILIAGFDLSGDPSLVLNWNNGTPHNNLSKKLAEAGSSTVDEMPEIASHADSIGWTKIVKGDIFKRYMSMYPTLSKEMKVCEDFPSMAMLLYKDSRVTGLPENMYDYYKHPQSSTAKVKPDDFRVVRLGFLKTLQEMVANNREMFVDDAEKYINKFLEVKYHVIGNIVDKKTQSGDLVGYTKNDWQRDFQTAINCEDLNIEKIKGKEISPAIIQAIKGGGKSGL